jgi:hypothetical protein
MGAPPFEVGAVKARDNAPLDAVIDVMVGAEDVVRGVPDTAMEADPSPKELMASSLIW